MAKLLIIADDFAEALDAGVRFAARGAKTKVVTDSGCGLADAESDVLVLDTETRHAAPEDACALVDSAASSAKEAGIPHIYIYKEIGPDLRDNTGSELVAALNIKGRTQRRPKLVSALFMICGSTDPVTRRQIKEAERCGFRRICLAVRQKLDPEWLTGEGCAQNADRWFSDAKTRSRMILDANDEAADKATKQFAAENGLDTVQIRERISSALAGVTKELLDRGMEATLMCTEVGTLMSLMKAVGVSAVTPVRELDKGVVLSCFTYRKKNYYAISKPDGLGEPDLLCRLAEQIGA